MSDFKPMVKMACGGSVSKAVAKTKMKSGGGVSHTDIKEDKKLIRRAVNLHDDQLHEGKKTDLSTLKKGGRCKKEKGTVTKYKGSDSSKPKKMADGGLTDPILQKIVNAEVLKQKSAPQMAMKKGGKVKKMAVGGMSGAPSILQGLAKSAQAQAMKPVASTLARQPVPRPALRPAPATAEQQKQEIENRMNANPGMDPFARVPTATPASNQMVIKDPGYTGPVGNVPSDTGTRPVANATGPMTPVRGGGMAPASVATMMKKGGKAKRGCK